MSWREILAPHRVGPIPIPRYLRKHYYFKRTLLAWDHRLKFLLNAHHTRHMSDDRYQQLVDLRKEVRTYWHRTSHQWHTSDVKSRLRELSSSPTPPLTPERDPLC